MPPFAVDFAPSKLRRWAVVLLTAWFLSCVAAYWHVSGSLKAVAAVVVVLCGAWAWCEPRQRVRRLEVDTQGRAKSLKLLYNIMRTLII